MAELDQKQPGAVTCKCGTVNPPGRQTCTKCHLPLGPQAQASPRSSGAVSTIEVPEDSSGWVLVFPDFSRRSLSPGDRVELCRDSPDEAVAKALVSFTQVHRGRHAVLTLGDDTLTIADVKEGGHGTYVNDVRLKTYDSTPLKTGDVIRLADTCFFTVDGPHGR